MQNNPYLKALTHPEHQEVSLKNVFKNVFTFGKCICFSKAICVQIYRVFHATLRTKNQQIHLLTALNRQDALHTEDTL